jgi:hypothetical protein
MAASRHAVRRPNSTSTRVASIASASTIPAVRTIWPTTFASATAWIAPPMRSPVADLLADLSRPGLEDEFMERAVARSIDGVTVPVVDVSDLVILKVLAGRPKDAEDLASLLAIHRDDIDERRVRHVLALRSRLWAERPAPAFT